MKGKYAARSALRREDGDVRAEIGSYQHHIKRLTAENKELRDKLATERSERKREVRKLKAQLDEGLSPEVVTLRRELERQRERADHAERDRQETRKKWNNAFTRMYDLYRTTEGEGAVDALDTLLQFCNPELDPGTLAGAGTMHEGARQKLGTQAAERIDRARRFTNGTDQLALGKPAPSRFDRWVDPK